MRIQIDVKIKKKIYHDILHAFPAVPPESGCILGSRDGIVEWFAYDSGSLIQDAAMYIPDTKWLNGIIDQWSGEQIEFCGLAHSHPDGQDSLSGSDTEYIDAIMRAMPGSINRLFFPLVFPGKKMIAFTAFRNRDKIEILFDEIIIL